VWRKPICKNREFLAKNLMPQMTYGLLEVWGDIFIPLTIIKIGARFSKRYFLNSLP
jgi:hypothetical protein